MTHDQDQNIGRYRVCGTLGKGAFGTVYRAVLDGPHGFRRDVAIKRLIKERERGDSANSLIDEARLGGFLHHTNIVEVYELAEENGSWFVAMEFVDGASLRAILEQCRRQRVLLPPMLVLEIGIQVCRGLHHAHLRSDEQGKALEIVHRDLKPGNLMLASDGTVKILDFGIAKAVDNISATASGTIKGSPAYMSPEQAQGNHRISYHADLFSLGSILYELLTNEVLFDGSSVMGTMFQVVHQDVAEKLVPLDDLVSGITPILSRALHKEPPKRFDSAQDMGKAIAELRHRISDPTTLADLCAALFSENQPSHPTLEHFVSQFLAGQPWPNREVFPTTLSNSSEPTLSSDSTLNRPETARGGATEETSPVATAIEALPNSQDTVDETLRPRGRTHHGAGITAQGSSSQYRSEPPSRAPPALTLGIDDPAGDPFKGIRALPPPPRPSRVRGLLFWAFLMALSGIGYLVFSGQISPPAFLFDASPLRDGPKGTLAVTSLPSNLDVRVNGHLLGTTPLIIDIAAGTHRVSVLCPTCPGEPTRQNHIELRENGTISIEYDFHSP